MEAPTTPTPVTAIAERYYRLAWRHYMFQVSCIGPDDYARMQEHIGYPETYEEHMASLVRGIPHDPHVMIHQIAQFITKYIEFQDPKYADTIDAMTERMRADKEQFKLNALKVLMETQTQSEAGAGAEADNDDPPPRFSGTQLHPPLFETYIGPAHFVLPTYGNPMMTALYGLLFVCYAQFLSAELDHSEPSGQRV